MAWTDAHSAVLSIQSVTKAKVSQSVRTFWKKASLKQLFNNAPRMIELETYQAMLWYSSKSIILKKSKIALLEYFSTGTKIVGNHSKFYLSLMKTSGKHPVHF